MLVKLGIIGALLIVVGIIFSSEINGLFPNTTNSVIESLQNDVHDLSTKASESVENRLDTSIEKVVNKTSEKIYDGIDDVKSSKELISNEFNKINPTETLEHIFKNKSTEYFTDESELKTKDNYS